MGVTFSNTRRRPYSQGITQNTPPTGENKRDLPITLNFNECVDIENYEVNERGVRTRGGARNIGEVTGTLNPTMLKRYGTALICSYNDGTDTLLRKVSLTGAFTTVKTWSTTTAAVSGVEFDDYFIAGNGSDVLGYTHRTGQFINYDGQGTSLTAGQTLTFSGGATAKLVAQNDAGATGTLLITDASAAIGDGETITDPLGGDGTTDGTIYDWYELASSPKAKYVTIHRAATGGAPFLVATNIEDNTGRTQSSKAYTDVTTLPFTVWSGAASPPDADDPFEDVFGQGANNSLVSHGDLIVIGADNGTKAFKVSALPISTKIAQELVLTHQEQNFGMFRGAISTPYGIFYGNENGLYIMNFSQGDKIETEITNILGKDELDKYTFDDLDIVWDNKEQVHFYFKRSATKNNFGITYNIRTQTVSEITGQAIKRVCLVGTDIYGISSRECKIYKLFSSQDDDGQKINTRILSKEYSDPNRMRLINIPRFNFFGKLDPSEQVDIAWHVWDLNNKSIPNAYKVRWTNSGIYDITPFGTGITGVGMPEAFTENEIESENLGWKIPKNLRNMLKYQIEITSSTFSTHELHLFHWLVETTPYTGFGSQMTKLS